MLIPILTRTHVPGPAQPCPILCSPRSIYFAASRCSARNSRLSLSAESSVYLKFSGWAKKVLLNKVLFGVFVNLALVLSAGSCSTMESFYQQKQIYILRLADGRLGSMEQIGLELATSLTAKHAAPCPSCSLASLLFALRLEHNERGNKLQASMTVRQTTKMWRWKCPPHLSLNQLVNPKKVGSLNHPEEGNGAGGIEMVPMELQPEDKFPCPSGFRRNQGTSSFLVLEF